MQRRQLAMVGGTVATLALCMIGVIALRGSDRADQPKRGDGPLPVELSLEQARDYLERIGYPNVRIANNNKLVTAQDNYCATSDECKQRKPKIVFDFADGPLRARCIEVSHSYDLDWRRIVGKLIGVAGEQLPELVDNIGRDIDGPAGKFTVKRTATRVTVGTACP